MKLKEPIHKTEKQLSGTVFGGKLIVVHCAFYVLEAVFVCPAKHCLLSGNKLEIRPGQQPHLEI